MTTFAVVLTAALAAAPIAPLAAQVDQSSKRNSKVGAGLTVPFSTTGLLHDGIADVTGTFTMARFETRGGELVAVGTLAASVLDNGAVRTVIQELAVPVVVSSGAAPAGVAVQQTSCAILHLELGPLDLDLLGLVVHLDRIVLDISAEPGSGNLLGNLLCQISGLLDGGSPLSQILTRLVRLLNDLIAAL